MSAIDAVIRGAKKEVQDVRQFIQSPRGVFETIDAMVRDARGIVFESLASVGLNRPLIGTSLLGTQSYGRPLDKVRQRLQSAKSRMGR